MLLILVKDIFISGAKASSKPAFRGSAPASFLHSLRSFRNGFAAPTIRRRRYFPYAIATPYLEGFVAQFCYFLKISMFVFRIFIMLVSFFMFSADDINRLFGFINFHACSEFSFRKTQNTGFIRKLLAKN